ncbi:MAG TPA: hypothetical protein DDX81_02135 [Desulfofustis sp.]|jgi:septal ring factor EnvC (AmiA/AmiB activator)|nr:hypothetical protein [Desulfofustis sp.]
MSSLIKTISVRRVVMIVAGLASLALPAASLNAETAAERAAKKEEIAENIELFRINIRKLQEGIKAQRRQIEAALKKEQNLLAELEDIDVRLLRQKDMLTELQARMSEQRQLIEDKNQQLAQTDRKKADVQRHLQARIEAFYKTGEIGFINVAFSTQTLPELLRFQDSFKTLIQYDQDVIDIYRQTIDELAGSIQALEREEAVLADFIEQNSIEQEKLNAIRDEKINLLARVRTQTSLHEQAIAELEDAGRSLDESIGNLKQEKEMVDQSFARSRGKLPPPVAGTVIVGYDQQWTNRLGITRVSKGIAIEAEPGTIVRAIHEGVVSFAGYLRGYGNAVIINHGFDYYSVISRLERLLVKKGERVDEHDDIGIMGETAMLLSDGMYLEIRHKNETLDPLVWLDTRQLRQP